METFPQPKITGYRQLNEAEVALMNWIKEFGNINAFTIIDDVKKHVAAQRKATAEPLKNDWHGRSHEEDAEIKVAKAEIARIDAAQPERWIAIANTHFQEGLMALTRAVAQPGSF